MDIAFWGPQFNSLQLGYPRSKCNMRAVTPGSTNRRVGSDREEKEANIECPNKQVTTEKPVVLPSIGNLGEMA